MSEYIDAGHAHLAAAGQEEFEAEHDADFEQFKHVEFDDGHGGHYEVTDFVAVHEHDIEHDVAVDEAQARAEVHEVERDIEYEHVHHVEYDDGHGGHFEETDFTDVHEHELEVDAERVDGGGHLGAASGGHLGAAGSDADADTADAARPGSYDGEAPSLFGPAGGLLGELERRLGFGDDLGEGQFDLDGGDSGGHLGVAPHDPDAWVSN
jgi:hypothetical protein